MSLAKSLEQTFGAGKYTYVGFTVEKFKASFDAPTQCGTSCDLCATAITYVYRFRTPSGHVIKLGSECAKLAGNAQIASVIKREETKRAAVKRAAKALSVETELTALLETKRAELESLPHPSYPGKTLLDWANFMLILAGAAGKAKVLKAIKSALKG